MNGSSLLIDSNIAIQIIGGNETLAKLLSSRFIYASFITELEILGFKKMSPSELKQIQEMLDEFVIIDINQQIKEIVIELRKTYSVKLPDAIIAATSVYLNIPLLSSDKKLKQIQELSLLFYPL